jgi:hypothetical protein
VKSEKLQFSHAFKKVSKKRLVVNPNIGFTKQLDLWGQAEYVFPTIAKIAKDSIVYQDGSRKIEIEKEDKIPIEDSVFFCHECSAKLFSCADLSHLPKDASPLKPKVILK